MSKLHEAILQETQTPMRSTRWWFAASQGNQMGFTFSIQCIFVLSIGFLVSQGSFQTLFYKGSK